MSNTYAFHDHQNKAIGLIKGLRRLGWTPSSDPDLFLIDFDGPPYYQQQARDFARRGATVAVYPHGATAQLCTDIWPVSRDISVYLAFSEGQAEVLRRIGYPHPVHVTGWNWCEQLPTRPLGEIRRLLFAPIHSLGNGFLHPRHAEANRRAFEDILASVSPDVVSVRLSGSPAANGIWTVPGVEYHQAALDNTTHDMDRADLVVSYGTFAYLAVARGQPVVMYGHDYPFFDGNSAGEIITVKHWDRYADYMRYPVSKLADLPGSEEAVAEWRRLFIGEQMTPEKLQGVLDAIFSD